jgi:uncharacterized membrane protein YphA (DoxX/SURF4 family)
MSDRDPLPKTPDAPRSKAEQIVVALLRIAVGWHFAYEGLAKAFGSVDVTRAYLQSATWIGADLFHWIAANPDVLWAVHQVNAWGLWLIGAALILGGLTRWVAIVGMVLLGLYYVAHPPLFAPQTVTAVGNSLIVNKVLVELLALAVIAVLPAGPFGLDGFIRSLLRSGSDGAAKGDLSASIEPLPPQPLLRRQLLAGLVGLPFIGVFMMAVLKKRGYASQEEKQLANQYDGLSGATKRPFQVTTRAELKGQVPRAKLGDLELSRIILGGNLMNGFAHARDLIYVSNLIRAYHNREKVFETFRLAEECGFNTIITNPILAGMITEYWERGIGKIKFIAQCKGKNEKDLLDNVRYSIDHGACAAYVQGAVADSYVKNGHFDWIAKALDMMRDAGLPAGIGGHYIQTIKGCVDQGFEPDFWMKTLHHHNYWSATPHEEKDNMWCEDPEQTIAFMRDLPQPWIAFKVLAAGSIPPKDGFKYAFENGADFVCAGMYDFQVVDNANVALSVLNGKLNRKRDWQAV